MKFLLSILILISFLGSLAQTEPVVAPTKMNVLYRTVGNPINIAVPNYSCDDLIVSIDNGTISGTNCQFIVIPGKAKLAVITVMTIKEGDTILLGSSEFRVKQLPRPIVSFCGKSFEHNDIPRENLLTCKGLSLYFEGFDYRPPHKVVSFDFYIIRDKCIIQTFSANGGDFTDEMIKSIKNLKTGDTIEIDNIKGIDPTAKLKVIGSNNEVIETDEKLNEVLTLNRIKLNVK